MDSTLCTNIMLAATFITMIAGMIVFYIKILHYKIKDEMKEEINNLKIEKLKEMNNLKIEMKEEMNNLKIEIKKLNSKFDLLDEQLNNTKKQMEIYQQRK